MINELARRNAGWIDGSWIALADGQQWCFPPPGVVPGYDPQEIGREVVDSIMPLLNIDAIKQQVASMQGGNPEGILRTIGSMFAMYQAVFQAGFRLLSHNYSISINEYEALMPFNYQLSDLGDPHSKVHTATPQLLAIVNEVARISAVDVGPQMNRIAESN